MLLVAYLENLSKALGKLLLMWDMKTWLHLPELSSGIWGFRRRLGVLASVSSTVIPCSRMSSFSNEADLQKYSAQQTATGRNEPVDHKPAFDPEQIVSFRW